MKKEMDAKSGTAVFSLNGKEISVNLQGVDAVTFTHLALVGLHELLVKRRNPEKAWQDIRNGKLVKQKRYPPIVHAIAEVYSLPKEDADAAYASLSRAQKMELREDTRIKDALLRHEKPRHVDLEKFLTD